MATMDVFNSDAFSTIEMSDAVRRMPYRPNYLESLNIFTPKPIRTTAVMVEQKHGKLALITTSQRGAPIEEKEKDKRDARYFETVRLAKGSTLTAAEIQNVRAFGTESVLQQMMAEVNERMSGPAGLLDDLSMTKEHMYLGAVQGIVYDADGSTAIRNWFTEWGITAATEVDFDLDNASPVSGALRKKCNGVTRASRKAAQGLWQQGTTLVGLCGDAFYDDLVTHPEVRETYLNQQEASDLRNTVGAVYEEFRFGNITWVNYRGTDDGTTVGIGTDKVKFFPRNAPGIFQVAYAPLEDVDFANTLGRSVYSMIVRDKDRNFWVRPEVYSYLLPICTTPGALQSGKRT